MKFSTFYLAFFAPALTLAATNCTVVSTYSVKSGDTLTKIAASYNVTLQALESVNTQITNFNSISVNETINIPNVGCTTDICAIVSNYTVQSGDTLTTIAAKYSISLAALESVNTQISNFNFISVNETIHIPATTCVVSTSAVATANCVESGNATYTVVSGDTFYVIANDKLAITLAALEAANPQITNYDAIEVGQVIKVPICGTCVSSTSKYGNGTYTVVSGDTFYIISSEKLNITLASFEAANTQVKDYTMIDIGQVLNVPVCSTKSRRWWA